MLNAIIHLHTKYSHDSLTEPRELLKVSRKLKFDVLGITDHNTTKGALEAKRIAKREFPEILVLVGQEVKTDYGDIIVFGTGEDMPFRLFELVERARSEGLFVLLPHPFDRLRKSSAVGMNLDAKGLEKLAKKLDAVEVFNSRCLLDGPNKTAQDFAERHGLSEVAGSDAHDLEYFGRTYNILDCEKKEASVLGTLKRGNFLWTGQKMPYSWFFRRGLSKLRNSF
ncbi:MAG: PHP-associated domain-containing protein [Candidatus Aenigmatarchaeota archaeon]